MPIITKEYWTRSAREEKSLFGQVKKIDGWLTVDLTNNSARDSFSEKLRNLKNDDEIIQSFFVSFIVDSSQVETTGLQCFLERIPANWLSSSRMTAQLYLTNFFVTIIEFGLKNPTLTSPSAIIKIIYHATIVQEAKKYFLDEALACFLSNAHIYERQEVEAIYTLFFSTTEDNNFFLEVFFSLPKDVKRLASVHFFEKVPEDEKDNQALLFFKAFLRYELALNTENFGRLLRLSEALQANPKDFQNVFSTLTENLQEINLEWLESIVLSVPNIIDDESQTDESDEQEKLAGEPDEVVLTSRASLTSRRSVPDFKALEKIPAKTSSKKTETCPIQNTHREPIEPLKLFGTDGELLPLLKEMSPEVRCYNILKIADKIYQEDINQLFVLEDKVFSEVYSKLEASQKQKFWSNLPFQCRNSEDVSNTLTFF